jgi:UDP-2-acetamido-2,6-beta-L-arabino-hexul-4-ose reductase
VGTTGAGGFVGQHLVRRLAADQRVRVETCPRAAWDDAGALDRFAAGCDVIVHLAGVNRGTEQEIGEVNTALVEKLIAAAQRCARPPHIVFASSTQRERDNAYGRVKRQCENRLAEWVDGGRRRAATVLVIPNVYGPGCRPFYNSVVATFCHQLAQGEEPTIVEDASIDFVWINDLVDQIADVVASPAGGFGMATIQKTGTLSVSALLDKLQRFCKSRFCDGVVPDLSDRFDASLFATLESYFDIDRHAWQPQVHADDRGRLFEILKLAGGGQVFFSTTRPGVVRGNHYHTRKIEWFCVVEGEAAIRIRRVGGSEVREFRVSGREPKFVSIPVWHVHQIENTGDSDLLTMFWTNEIFNADDPDTYYEKVA